MSSSSESENELAFHNFYREDGVIEPFRFEPLRSEMEVDEGNGASSSTLQADDTVDKREWCYCKKCEQSDVIKEKVCCLNPKVFENNVFENHLCITETEAFASVCLNRFVLQAAIGTWNQDNREPRNFDDKNFRFIAYKQYISWSYGYLGKRKRKPLPICVIQAIRRKYPDPNNMYIPYHDIL